MEGFRGSLFRMRRFMSGFCDRFAEFLDVRTGDKVDVWRGPESSGKDAVVSEGGKSGRNGALTTERGT